MTPIDDARRAGCTHLGWLAHRLAHLGFGFEGISGTTTPNDVMDRVVDYLLR